MSKTINNLNKSLKDLMLTEEQVQGLIDNNLINVQQYKLTTDDGQGFGLSNQNADTCTGSGTIYFGENITNSPVCAVGTWWTIENYITADGLWGHQIATAWHSNETHIRRKINGTFDRWRRLVENSTTNAIQTQLNNSQLTKMTEDNGACRGIPGNDANQINITGMWMGANVINGPSGVSGQWVYIESFVHNNLYQFQRATDLHNSSVQWIRHKTGGNWSEWRSL